MTLYLTTCGCTQEVGFGAKRDRKCQHGNVFYKDGKKPGRGGSTLKRAEPKRDWTLARAKIDEEGGLCRVCGAFSAEAAHIMGRKFDQPISPGSKTLLVLPDRIVPLCAELTGRGCHARYDAHELDLLPHLTTAEQAQAVLDAGSIQAARKRLDPVSHNEEVKGAAA